MSVTFRHGGGIGDVLVSLDFIREHGNGKAVLYLWGDYNATHSVMPFVAQQEGIAEVHYTHDRNIKADYKLDLFRNVRGFGHRSIRDSHYVYFDKPIPPFRPWLKAAEYKEPLEIVIHRSGRYRQHDVDWSFLRRCDDVVKIGYDYEVKELPGRWLPTPTWLDAAPVINSAKVFIGNQSSPLNLRIGLGKARLLEECKVMPDCWYGQPNELKLTSDPDKNCELLEKLL